MTVQHFLTLSDLGGDGIRQIVARACEMKRELREQGKPDPTRPGRVLAMLFEKSSTRTRVSFETAMVHLGGHAIFLSPHDTQLGRGEPIEDTARVLSRMVDCVMIRTYEHANLVRYAQHSDIPVINGLSDTHHPCQLLADLQTYFEYRGDIAGRRVAWLGDGNNMCHSYIEAAGLMGFQLAIACPPSHCPDESLVAAAAEYVTVMSQPDKAVQDADLVVTDVWTSMGQESESAQRLDIFRPYQVHSDLLALAQDDALFMHCLPAHRGEEVTDDVIEGPHSVVWDEAGNRLHSQKALLEYLLI